MRQLLVVCSVILLLGTFSGCRTDPQDILLGTEESVTEEVSGEIPVLKSESENVKQEESEENASSEIKDSEYPEADDTGKTVFVYVCGAVCQPGVYELSAQSRAYEAVAMAGGLLENARSDAVNLAEVLTDGQKLHIPYIGEDAVAEASGQTTATDSKEATDATVNINTATVDMLMTLKGIGQTRAEDIIAYREKHGSFQNKEDIMNVEAIKQGTYDKIKDNISVQSGDEMAKKVLVVDDEKLIVKGIRFSLEQDGMEVDCAYDGEEALEMAHNKQYDIILLDIMLPKLDGFQVCQQIREFSNVPIVMLTAKGDDMDKILGLEYGADDYITKPFNILEVKARIKAIMRRTSRKEMEKNPNVIVDGDVRLDCESRRLFIQGREISLTEKDIDLMELMVKTPEKVYSRERLLNLVWGYEYPGDFRTVDVHVRRLREKVEANPSEPKYVHTKWGVGYYYHSDKQR